MKKLCILFAFLVVVFPSTSFGQDSLGKVKLYNTWIKTMATEKIKRIYTYDVEQENITIISKYQYDKVKMLNEADLEDIAISNLKVVSFRKQGNVWKKGLMGTASALVIGGTLGFIWEKDYDPDQPAMWLQGFVIGAAVSAPIGFAIGSAFGFIKTRFLISGNQESFEKVHTKLEKRSIKYYY